MINERKRPVVSVCLKIALIICAVVGLLMCFFAGGFMGGKTLFLYFTIQSNIWIALVDIVLVIMQIKAFRGGKYTLPHAAYVFQQIFTVSITLTGVVYCFVLLPAFLAEEGGAAMALAPSQMLLHVAVPVLAIVDLIGFTRNAGFKKTDFLFAALPPIYYLCFSMVGFFLNWDFGGGNNYPYFFLNYGSPAGIVGFSNEMPYFMGSLYWILLAVVFVLGISAIFIALVNHLTKKLPRKI